MSGKHVQFGLDFDGGHCELVAVGSIKLTAGPKQKCSGCPSVDTGQEQFNVESIHDDNGIKLRKNSRVYKAAIVALAEHFKQKPVVCINCFDESNETVVIKGNLAA